jgi:hypothetical protein
MNYYKKYIKYKKKYLQYKNNKKNLIGGTKKIFNLSHKYNYKKGKLQDNLMEFEKEFGNNFQIKYKENILDINFEKIKLPNEIKFYRLTYDIPYRTTNLAPLIIDFFDIRNSELNNISYIYNIHKTNKLSGSDLVDICIKINDILGTQKIIVRDGTKVKCNNNQDMDLSFIKLLEKNKTFYMNFNFDFEIDNNILPYWKWSDKDKFLREINRLLTNIKNIKTSDIIKEYEGTLDLINIIIKDNYKGKFNIIISNSEPTRKNEIFIENPKEKIKELFDESKQILDILYKYKNENNFYKILINLFKNNCTEYLILYNYIVKNLRIKIIYNKKIIERKYVEDFDKLIIYKNYTYSYTFY